VFVAGAILTAADVNTNLMDQAVMVFADAAARGSAIPTPSEGMVTYLSDTNQVQAYNGAAFAPLGTILQVVSTTKTDTFTTTSTSFTAVTGLSVTITPSSASSKILVSVYGGFGADPSSNPAFFRLTRGGTAIGVGDAEGSRVRSLFPRLASQSTNYAAVFAGEFSDSPATTSATTYALEVAVPAGTVAINRSLTDTDSAAFARGVSTITVMEVAG